MTVTNTGAREGTEVVQLYLRHDAASVTRPVRELKRFARVTLRPGESRAVRFTLAADDMAFYDLDMRRVVEPGTITLFAGGSSAATLEAHLTLTDRPAWSLPCRRGCTSQCLLGSRGSESKGSESGVRVRGQSPGSESGVRPRGRSPRALTPWRDGPSAVIPSERSESRDLHFAGTHRCAAVSRGERGGRGGTTRGEPLSGSA